ncbi:MAG: AAA family ATPase [Nitrososphaerales archaeon]
MPHTPDPIAKKYYDIGGELFEQNNHEKAVMCYTRAIEEDCEYGSAYFNRALSYALEGKYEEAAKDAETVLRLEPDCSDGCYVLGVICEYQHDYEGAVKWYKESLSKNPDYSQAKERLRNLESKMQHQVTMAIQDTSGELGVESDEPSSSAEELAEAGDRQQKIERTLILNGQIKGLALTKPRKKMEDVVGLEELKREFELSVIGPARRPEGLRRWNIESGLSVLLYGPSGCGKTLLVEALAGEIGAYILIFNLNEVLDMYSGNTEKNIHAIFQQARDFIASGKTRYIVVFIDELDALGMDRGRDRDESGQRAATNQLLMELDGVEKNPEGLIIVGATNRPWDIDPALMRAGRFGDEWYVSIPSTAARKSLFELYLKGVPLGDVDCQRLARVTRTYSPADIKRVVRIAKFRAMDREGSSGKQTVMNTEDALEVIRGNQASSLYSWFLAIAEEFASKPLDRTKYKRIIEDMVTILGRRARARHGGRKGSLSPRHTRAEQPIPAYA